MRTFKREKKTLSVFFKPLYGAPSPLRALLLDCDGGGACDAVGVNLVRRQAEAGWHVAVRAEQAVHSRKWIARTDGLDSLCFVV